MTLPYPAAHQAKIFQRRLKIWEFTKRSGYKKTGRQLQCGKRNI